jgi:hypothetical protein
MQRDAIPTARGRQFGTLFCAVLVVVMIVDFTGEDRDYVAPICLGTNHDDVKIRG